MRLLLGIPTSGAPAAPFLQSLTQLHIPPSIRGFDRIIVSGNYVPAQRELIVRKAVDTHADLLLMCDDDMILPQDALAKLVSVLENDARCALAGALYYSRDGFRPMAVDRWNPNDTTSASIPAFAHAPVEVAGLGFGCVLLRMSAVRVLDAPFFSAHVFVESDPPRVRVCNEDYLFCSRLRDAGYAVVLHAGVRCGHYDRSSGISYPPAWEDDAATSVERMAVLENGEKKLVPLAPAQPGHERHERVEITYLWAD